MSDGQFTPTTRQVRDGYRFAPRGDYHDPVSAAANADRNGRAFDRWLRRHEEKVMAEAWREGYDAGALTGYSPMADSNTNPYRDET